METYPARFDMAGTETFIPVYAGFFRRVAAFVIDGTLLFLVYSFLLTSVVGEVTFQTADDPAATGVMWFMFFLTVLYSALMESSPMQATLGKIVTGIQVTNMEGKRISVPNAFSRSAMKILSCMFMFIGCIVAAFTKKHQALHDMPTNCLVLRKGSAREAPGIPAAVTGQVQSPGHARNMEMLTGRAQPPQASTAQPPPTGRDVIEEWDTGGALVKAAPGDIPAIVSSKFHKTLSDALAKAGLPMWGADFGDRLRICGHFVQIDGGNRALRYFTSCIGGKARIEVEGVLFINGAGVANLYAKWEQGFIFAALGGDNQKMLELCATSCGLEIAKQVTGALGISRGKGRK